MSARNFVARPESVTVIAWLLIVFGGFGLMGCLVAWTMRDWPMMQPLLNAYRVSFMVVTAVAGTSYGLHIVCGAGLLMRQSWARHVYVITAMLMLAFSMWTSPWPQFVMPSLLFPIVALMFLYRPNVNRWFDSKDVAGA